MMINSISAEDIKRRGIEAVDDLLEYGYGSVHVIKDGNPAYVVMTETRYREFVEAEEEATVARVNEALEEVKAGLVTRYDSVEDLIRELGLDE